MEGKTKKDTQAFAKVCGFGNERMRQNLNFPLALAQEGKKFP
jgi:hypothetical protein